MSCDILQDPTAPSGPSSGYLDPTDGSSVGVGSGQAHPLSLLPHPPRLLECKEDKEAVGRHWGTENEQEEELGAGGGDADGDGEERVQYQCDVSCYGLAMAGEVNREACHVTGGVDARRRYWGEESSEGGVDDGGGFGGSSWTGPNEATPYINEIRDECHIPTGHNQMEGCSMNDNEMLRGYHPGRRWWECREGDGGGGDESNGEGRGGGLEHRGGGGRTSSRPDNYPPSRHTFDSDPLDDARHDKGRLTPQEAGKIGFPRPSGVQLPVMTIEIEKWLMGLFVSDEEDGDRKKKTKNRKKGKKKRDGLHQAASNTHLVSSNMDTFDNQGLDDNLHYEVR